MISAVHIGAIVLAVLFGVAAIVYVVLAVIHVATTPRVSFSESYRDSVEDASTGEEPVVSDAVAPAAGSIGAEPSDDASTSAEVASTKAD